MVSRLRLETDTEFYVDDTATHAADKHLRVVETKLQSSANKLDSWGIDNNVLVNYTKTFAMLIGCRYTTSTDEEISVSLNGYFIDVRHKRFLGITIYSNLTWEQQIHNVCQN